MPAPLRSSSSTSFYGAQYPCLRPLRAIALRVTQYMGGRVFLGVGHVSGIKRSPRHCVSFFVDATCSNLAFL